MHQRARTVWASIRGLAQAFAEFVQDGHVCPGWANSLDTFDVCLFVCVWVCKVPLISSLPRPFRKTNVQYSSSCNSGACSDFMDELVRICPNPILRTPSGFAAVLPQCNRPSHGCHWAVAVMDLIRHRPLGKPSSLTPQSRRWPVARDPLCNIVPSSHHVAASLATSAHGRSGSCRDSKRRFPSHLQEASKLHVACMLIILSALQIPSCTNLKLCKHARLHV